MIKNKADFEKAMSEEILDKAIPEIRRKLKGMKDQASARRLEKYWFDVNGKKRYVRINSDSFRAVSLDAENPCGHLIRDNKEVGGKKTLKSAIDDAADKNCSNHNPGNLKSEHKIQAYIIWRALTDRQSLPALLKITNHVDELWFVTDELSMDSIRADIVMLGCKNNVYFPVFIELKYKRTTDVALQLKYDRLVALDVGLEFRQFLSAATGQVFNEIQMERSLLIVIWGQVNREGLKAEQMRSDHGVLTICHSEEKDSPNEFEFSLN